MKNVNKICSLYAKTPELHKKGIHVISTDEMTGIQALEHIHKSKPMKPGSDEKIEFEYKRQGTTTLIGNFDVATGKLLHSFINATRTEEDFVKNIKGLISNDPAGEWIIVVDGLNIHKSTSLVKFVASACDLDIDLGKKGKEGILKSQSSRKKFLEDETHRIRFVYTPKHCSWLNQIEIWFSILKRKLLNRRISFKSVKALEEKILDFIEYQNKNAKPFKWTYKGMVLQK